MTIWQLIYNKLKEHNIDVYSPGQHKGDCTSPYVVVKDTGVLQVADFTSNQHLYDVMCYVPKDSFSTLEEYVEEVKLAMKELYPGVKYANSDTASYYDDSNHSHMISSQYINYRKQ